MKKIRVCVLLLVIGCQSFSQKKQDKTYFSLSDTVFTAESYCILPEINFYLSGGGYPCPSSFENLDSIVSFLKKYPRLVVEIGCHTDCRPIPMTNDTLTQRRAEDIVKYFIEKGIDSKRLIAKGYGEHQPRTLEEDVISRGFTFKKGTVLTPECIKSLPSRDQQEAAHDLNRRNEMKIIRIDY